MPAITEMFNGGLVTVRHPALLAPGELQRADDTVYREKDPAIWIAPGRSQYGTAVSGSPVLGLAYLPFENKYKPKVLAYAGDTLYSLPVRDTGTEVAMEIGGPGVVTGAITNVGGHTFFTAASGAKPFLFQTTVDPVDGSRQSIIGARVFGAGLNGSGVIAVVYAVSGSPTNNRYPSVEIRTQNDTSTIVQLPVSAAVDLTFQWGTTQSLQQDSVARNNFVDVAQYGSAYFAWFGFGPPRKIEWAPVASTQSITPNLSQRPLGLTAVTDPITLVLRTGAITGSTGTYAWRASLGTGYFWFLVTEIYVVQKEGTDGVTRDVPGSEIESAYLAPGGTSNTPGEPVAIAVPDLVSGVRIVLPAVKNTGLGGRIATHWGIYMSPLSTVDGSSRPSLATFRRIGRPAIKTFAAGTSADGDPGIYEVFERTSSQTLYATSVAAVSGSSDWANSSAMLGAPDGGIFQTPEVKYGRGVSNSSVSAYGAVTPKSKLSYSIDTSGLLGAQIVTGLQVTVFGRANSDGDNQEHASAYLYPTNGAGKDGVTQFLEFTNLHASQSKVLGGQGDTFGVSFGAFSTLSTFGIVIGVGANDADMATWIDAVKIVLFGSSATIDINGKPYRCVVYRDQIGTTVAEPAYGTPPSCSTADFFQGMFAMNDLEDDTAIRYSLPGSPEYFPKPYVMRLNSSKRRDKVTLIRTLGQVLIVGLENSIERVNYLPREVNTDLEDGLAHEELASDHGIAGPLAAVKFDLPGLGTILAYASTAGVFMTNGINCQPLNMDLDWPNTVKLSALSSCVFRVYPKEKWLVLYYCPAGATHDRNTRALVFNYAQDKLKGGFLPCTGPITVSGRSSCELILGGAYKLLTGHETSGLIYKEDVGSAQASGYLVYNAAGTTEVAAPILPVVRSRKVYAAGSDRDAYGEKLYLLFSPYGLNTFTAVANSTINTNTLSSASAVFTTITAGMRVLGSGIDPGTIVLSVAGDFKSVVLSRVANATGTAVTFTFDTGTLGVTLRGSNLGESVKGLSTDYVSTLAGDMVSFVRSNIRRGFEVQIEKVPLTFDSNGDTATSAALGTNMRLHNFTYILMDGGPDANRNAA